MPERKSLTLTLELHKKNESRYQSHVIYTRGPAMSFNREASEGSAISRGHSERCNVGTVNVRVHLSFTERGFKARLALSRYSYASCLPFASFFLIHVSESALRQRSNILSFG